MRLKTGSTILVAQPAPTDEQMIGAFAKALSTYGRPMQNVGLLYEALFGRKPSLKNPDFLSSTPEGLEEWGGREAKKRLVKIFRRWQNLEFLPNAKHVKLLHSILKPGDNEKIIRSILRQGLRAQSTGSGAHSEDPNAIFMVEGTPNKVHNNSASYIMLDLPIKWEGWVGSVGRSSNNGPPISGAVVAIYKPIPAKYIVGVNGIPVKDYVKL